MLSGMWKIPASAGCNVWRQPRIPVPLHHHRCCNGLFRYYRKVWRTVLYWMETILNFLKFAVRSESDVVFYVQPYRPRSFKNYVHFYDLSPRLQQSTRARFINGINETCIVEVI